MWRRRKEASQCAPATSSNLHRTEEPPEEHNQSSLPKGQDSTALSLEKQDPTGTGGGRGCMEKLSTSTWSIHTHHPSLREDFYPALPAMKTENALSFIYLLSRNRAQKSWSPKFLLHCTSSHGMLWARNCGVSTLSLQAQPGHKLFLGISNCIALELQSCCPNMAPSASLYSSSSHQSQSWKRAVQATLLKHE